MEIKPYKNKFNFEVVDCPFCPHWVYVREINKVNPDALRDLKRHITNEAKNEAMARHLDAGSPTKHLNYYIEHTNPKVVPAKTKREYDADLKIK